MKSSAVSARRVISCNCHEAALGMSANPKMTKTYRMLWESSLTNMPVLASGAVITGFTTRAIPGIINGFIAFIQA